MGAFRRLNVRSAIHRLNVGLAVAVACAAGVALAVPTAASATARCAGPHPGGDWPRYGHDFSNTRSQPEEHMIGPANVASLGPAWTFSSQAAGGLGDFVGTPVEADGCVFAGTVGGFFFAINADTGKLVWRQKLRGDFNSSPTVHKGIVYAGVTDTTYDPCRGPGCAGPYAVAFDEHTGRVLWKTPPLDVQAGADEYSSPVIFDPRPPPVSTPGSSGANGRSCASRRSFLIRLRVPHGQHLVSARVYVNGRQVRVIRGPRLRARVVLTGLPRGRYRVTIAGVTDRGRHLRGVRRYRTCTSGHHRRGRHRARAARSGSGQLLPLLLMGISGWSVEGEHSLAAENQRAAYEGSVVILNAQTGELLKKVWTIHPPANGACPASTCPKGVNDFLSGATVWSTAAVDPAAKVAYFGTSNPFQPEKEADTANAIIKVGIDQTAPATFGRVLALGKGTPDQYTTVPDPNKKFCVNPPTVLDACLDQDLDFGASPNLFTDSSGRQIVGDGQKSGFYHAFDTRTMQHVYQQILGPPSLVGGIVGSPAYDGKSIIGPLTQDGLIWSINRDTGSAQWLARLGDGEHYGNPVAVANGVVYSTGNDGSLRALDALSGTSLLNYPFTQNAQTGSDPVKTYAGVSIARNTVYAGVGIQGQPNGFIIAFRLGGKGSPPPDRTPPAPSDTPNDSDVSGNAIVAGPGAQTAGYLTPTPSVSKGQPLGLRNLDPADHDVTSRLRKADGSPLFQSPRVPEGSVDAVHGVKALPAGSYEFYCSIHPNMTGTLTVTG